MYAASESADIGVSLADYRRRLLEPVLQRQPQQLFEPFFQAALFPRGQRDFLRVIKVVYEGAQHFAREGFIDHADVDLVVVHEAAPVEIRRAHRRPIRFRL